MTGAFTRTEGKWTPTITAPDGSVVEIGTFDTRVEASEAYKKKYAELYPPGPPTEVDPAKHHVLTGGDMTVRPPTIKN